MNWRNDWVLVSCIIVLMISLVAILFVLNSHPAVVNDNVSINNSVNHTLISGSIPKNNSIISIPANINASLYLNNPLWIRVPCNGSKVINTSVNAVKCFVRR